MKFQYHGKQYRKQDVVGVVQRDLGCYRMGCRKYCNIPRGKSRDEEGDGRGGSAVSELKTMISENSEMKEEQENR